MDYHRSGNPSAFPSSLCHCKAVHSGFSPNLFPAPVFLCMFLFFGWVDSFMMIYKPAVCECPEQPYCWKDLKLKPSIKREPLSIIDRPRFGLNGDRRENNTGAIFCLVRTLSIWAMTVPVPAFCSGVFQDGQATAVTWGKRWFLPPPPPKWRRDSWVRKPTSLLLEVLKKR